MATSVKYPTANTSSSGYDGTATNPTNAYTDDTSEASFVNIGRNKEYCHLWGGFDFSAIPAGSTINSVTVKITERVGTSWAEGTWRAALYPDITATVAIERGDTGAIHTVVTRGTTDTTEYEWNLGTLSTEPTLAQLQGTNFGIKIEVFKGNNGTNYTTYIDFVEITVDYTEGGAEASGTINGGGGLTAAVTHKASVSGTLNGGGGISATVTGDLVLHQATTAASAATPPWVSETFTPRANSLLVVAFVVEHESPNSGALSVAGGGLTWTLQETAGDDIAWAGKHRLWTAPVGGSPSSMAVTVDMVNDVGNMWVGWQVFDVVGHDVDTPLVQSTTSYVTKSGGDAETHTITLDAAPTVGEIVVGIFMAQNDVAQAFAEPSGFTVLSNLAGTTVHSMTVWRDDTTSTTIESTDLGDGVWWVFGTGLEVRKDQGGVEAAATLNGGGSITAAVTHKGSVAATVSGGGSIPTVTYTRTTATSVVELKFESLDMPEANDKTVLWIRHKVSSSSLEDGDITVALYEGTTLIKTISYGVTTSWTTPPIALSTAQHDAITDWSDLRVRISYLDPTGDTGNLQVADVWLTTAPSSGQQTASGVINGGGGLSATVTADHATSGTINGGGGISATVVAHHTTSGTINGGGSLSATAAPDHTTSGTINGGGSLAAAYTVDHTASGTLNTGGGITASVVSTGFHTTSGTIQGGGGLTATVTADHTTSGAIQGGGGLTATVAPDHSTSGVINGGGSISATVIAHHAVATSVQGGGGITATFTADHTTSATVQGGGGLAATVTADHTTSGTINGGGRIFPVNVVNSSSSNRQVSGTINAGGGLTSAVTAEHTTSATINGGGGISTAVTADHQTSGTINGGGSVTAAVSADHTTSVAISGGGSLSAATTADHTTSGAINTGGGLAPTVVGAHTTTGTISGGGGISATVINQSVTYLELGLFGLADPEDDTNHFITFRYSHPTGAQSDSMTWALVQGTTEIQSGSFGTSSTLVMQTVVAITTPASITDYADLRVRLEPQAGASDSLRIHDLWLTTPQPPPAQASGTINTGGSIHPTVIGRHIVPAFPSPDEGLMGPAFNAGGGISASAYKVEQGQVAADINTGGGITASVVAHHAVTGTLNTGGGITASIFALEPGQTYGIINTGGGITAAISSHRTVGGTIRSGGSIFYISWLDLGWPEGQGETDEGPRDGWVDRDRPPGITDDGTPPGETGGLQSPGRTE